MGEHAQRNIATVHKTHTYRDNIHDRSLVAHSTSEVGTSGINNYDARVCPNPYPALANVHTLSLI